MNVGNISGTLAEHIYEQLKERGERFVLAESCTGGTVASVVTRIPGISEHFCGSLVTYRPCCKRNWLGVKQDTIEAHTTESAEVACEMAKGALEACIEATWSASVVGHFSPDAPHNTIYVAVARRKSKGKRSKVKCKMAIEHDLKSGEDRYSQQMEATEVVLTALSRAIIQHDDKEKKKT